MLAAAIAGWLVIGPAAGDVEAAGEAPAAVRPTAENDLLPALQAFLFPDIAPDDVAGLRYVADIEQAGTIVGQVETLAGRAPRLLRETLTLAGVRQVATVVADTAWREDPNGAVRRATGDERTTFLLSHYFLFHRYLDGSDRDFLVEPEAGGLVIRPVVGGPARFLRVEPVPDAPSRRRPTRLVESHQGSEVVTTFEDWRIVDGVRVPFRTIQSSGDLRFDLVLTTTSVEILAEAPTGSIVAPQARRPDDADLVDAEQARRIPLRFAGSIPIVDVSVDSSRPLPFLVDTGAAATILDRAFADELDRETQGTLEARGAGGSEPAGWIEIGSLRLPGVEIRDQTIVTLPLESLGIALNEPVTGILGWDFLSRFAIEIDWPEALLCLSLPGAYAPRPEAVRVPLRIEANVPFIECRFEDLPPADFLLDTGNSAGLLIHTPFAALHGLDLRTHSPRAITGIGGTESMREMTVARFGVGSAEFRNVPALVATSEKGIVALKEGAGNVGGGLFAGGVLAIDYSAGALWFVPPQASSASGR